MRTINEDIDRIKKIMGIDEGSNGPAYKGPEVYDDSCDCYPEDEDVVEGEIEEEEDIFRLYTDQRDWPTALESCMKTFINMEEYEKCIIIQELQKEYEINKLVTESQKTPSTTRRKTTKK